MKGLRNCTTQVHNLGTFEDIGETRKIVKESIQQASAEAHGKRQNMKEHVSTKE